MTLPVPNLMRAARITTSGFVSPALHVVTAQFHDTTLPESSRPVMISARSRWASIVPRSPCASTSSTGPTGNTPAREPEDQGFDATGSSISTVAVEGGSLLMARATASFAAMTRSRFSPARARMSASDQPRRISSFSSNG